MAIGRQKLVDADTSLEAPFTIDEIKNARALADVLLAVYGARHTIGSLVLENRLHIKKARQESAYLSGASVSP